MQPWIGTNDGVYYYLFWDGPTTKGLKYFGLATQAQNALNGGTTVLQIVPASSWEFIFNDFYVAGAGGFAGAQGRSLEEMVAAVTPKGLDTTGEPLTVEDRATGEVVATALAA